MLIPRHPSRQLSLVRHVVVAVCLAPSAFAAAPTIASLSPASAVAGGPAFTLTINGANFATGASAKWGATALTTTYKSSTQLTAAVPASLIATSGSASVKVSTTGGTSAPATFLVVPAPACANSGGGDARLKGIYSFQFSQIDPVKNGQLALTAGSFTADGSGHITGGLQDTNSPNAASEAETSFTGTYSVGPDDRGLLTVKYTSGLSVNLCFALNAVGTTVAQGGHLVSDQTNEQIDSGDFFAQGGSAFTAASVKGTWALGLQGAKLNQALGITTRGAEVGYLTLDGTGRVTAGEVDLSQDNYVSGALTNTYKPQTGVTGTYTLASSGRGTLALTLAGGIKSNYIFYVAGKGQLLLLSSDPGGAGAYAVTAGRSYLRSTASFANSTLSGTSVLIGQALTETNSTYYNQRLIKAGIATWTGKGAYSETVDLNDAGVVTQKQASSGTYAVDAEGRATLSGTSPATYAYLVGPNQGFAIQAGPGVPFATFESQAVPQGGFVASSFDGAYSAGSVWYGFEEEKASSGAVTATGTGRLTGTMDLAPLLNGVIDAAPGAGADIDPDAVHSLHQAVSETYTAAATGRFLVRNSSGTLEALYLVSPTKGYSIAIDGAPWQPLEEYDHQ